jgi:para-aminobenzoate synthetase component 1
VEGVERVLAYIEAGDIYQANIARRFEGSVLPGSDPVVLFERLRETSSAPFGAYVDLGTKQVLSASPECLLRWDGNGDVSSFPIKGTAGREGSPEEDKEAARRLLADPKENAEHIMIVDLVRNDLGRVAEYGTVSVPEPMAVQSFPNVHHLVSRVSGRLAEGRTEEDLWKAVFPGGSITGAPKIRACEIIAEIEQAQRGIYCGAIGFLDPRGGGCANIPIRTGVVAGDRVFFHVGGGIVSDSSPEREAAETEVKARGWRRALAEKEPL